MNQPRVLLAFAERHTLSAPKLRCGDVLADMTPTAAAIERPQVVVPLTKRIAQLVHRGKKAPSQAMKYAPGPSQPTKKRQKIKFKKVSFAQLWRLLYRLIVLVAAVCYASISFLAVIEAQGLLREEIGELVSEGSFTSNALKLQIGTTTLRESPLVTDFLRNDTSPRNETIYLDVNGASLDACAMSLSAQAIYSALNLRTVYASVARDTAYNLSFVAENVTELIAPIVVCDVQTVVTGFPSLGVFNYLVRAVAHPDDVYIMTITFANQIYKINSQKEIGPAGVGTLTFVNDLRATRVDCHYIVSLGYPYEPLNFRVYTLTGLSDRGSWILTGIRNGDPDDLSKIVRVSTRSGFFIENDAVQANIFTERWLIPNDPIRAVTGSEWVTKPYVYDQWAWVHFIHIVFGVTLLSSLVVLVLISYRNFVTGRLWIGDGFVAVSQRTTLRTALVLATWYMNGFWALLEFCVFTANETSPMTHLKIGVTVIYADLLTLYIGFCGILGRVFRERIDPLLVVVSFHVGFVNRVAMVRWFPRVVTSVGSFSSAFYYSGMLPPMDGQSKVSPMRFWTPHNVHPVPAHIIASTLMPIFSMAGFVLLYIVMKKVYRYFYPDPLHIVRLTGKSAPSEDETSMRQRLATLTVFEIATGAKLANRFGVLAEYDNCLFIKGMKFATPDGIYSSGFVIASEKFLIQADDVWVILLMKLLRLRFTNLYMYEVKGSMVEQRARLVYPDTFTLSDLLRLNMNVLS